MGKLLIYLGIALVVIGLLVHSGQLSWLGKLPGDIAIKKGNSSFYFPIMTCLVVSAVLSLIMWFFRR